MVNIAIVAIPAFETNYLWVGVNRLNNTAFVVDPGDAKPVLAYLQKHGLTLTTILLTHKHADHTGGVKQLKALYPEVSIYGHPIESIFEVTHPVQDGQDIALSDFDIQFRVIHVPGHTLGHVVYYAAPLLFCGDTLFGAGCGRLFEGTAEEMFISLGKLSALPEDTLVYCSHEYTLSNLEFAVHVEPGNQQIHDRIVYTQALQVDSIPSVPSTMALEKATNPFLRCAIPEVMTPVRAHSQQTLPAPVEVFRELRLWRNHFN